MARGVGVGDADGVFAASALRRHLNSVKGTQRLYYIRKTIIRRRSGSVASGERTFVCRAVGFRGRGRGDRDTIL